MIWKTIVDHFFLHIVLVICIPLTFFEASFLPIDGSDLMLVLGLLALYIANVAVLMWLWTILGAKWRRSNRADRHEA